MDITVTETAAGELWMLTDLLGRNMGCIQKTESDIFVIKPAGQAIATLAGLTPKSYPSLDGALSAIETHTRGTCRRAP